MEISFNLPHVLSPGSSAGEKGLVLRALYDTLAKIKTHTRFDRGDEPTLIRNGSLATFKLPHVFKPGANPIDNAYTLRALLDGLTEINRAYLDYHPNTPALYQSGVRYGRTQLWEPIPALYGRRLGDCKSLSAALIAEKNRNGEAAKPVFRFRERRDKTGTDYHILVMTDEGWKDPSKVLGMGRDENAWFRG